MKSQYIIFETTRLVKLAKKPTLFFKHYNINLNRLHNVYKAINKTKHPLILFTLLRNDLDEIEKTIEHLEY
jgi:hypothetical protein